eukprot:CAMPEP_0198696106 /NCGR_PEP_ID=MMETSP1468-20131203/299853_1 /TAXON_ID=1461545 /ORGANISM="Mantoniella sp, Strain CCMP1436" /LENGTH=203 /DNA_ID=CAMNT_0044452171 /DNA_START=31 /DNA_END=642 /DNA_ORIENTATION=+
MSSSCCVLASAVSPATAAARAGPCRARAAAGARGPAAAPQKCGGARAQLSVGSKGARGLGVGVAALRRPTAAPVAAARRGSTITTAASGEDGETVAKQPFGYTRKDIIIIGVGTTVAGAAMYYGLKAGGVSDIWAGNIVQLTFVLGLTIGWVGSYIGRVANKDMTYVKQLKDYEDAVMAKRLEELPEAELEKMMEEISRLDDK